MATDSEYVHLSLKPCTKEDSGEMVNCFTDCVAKTSHNVYQSLPKTGKPQVNEWTLLASILQMCGEKIEGHDHPNLTVVALGTGTKCIGRGKMSNKGDILNDSHAEIIARRAFLRYLYHNIKLAQRHDESSIFSPSLKDGLFKLKPGISFHFYTSHPPCGDASIFPKLDEDQDNSFAQNLFVGDIIPREYLHGVEKGSFKRCYDEEGTDLEGDAILLKKMKTDIHRTGAKCLPTESKQDPKLPGSDFHVVGAVRTKPGRGDPTLSVSCSDKLMRWNIVGIQGALLSRLLEEPIYMKSITVGGGCAFSDIALRRAIVDRVLSKQISLPPGYNMSKPSMSQSKAAFPDRKRNNTARPCPLSIVWCLVPERGHEVAVEGRRHGVTKKNQQTAAGRLQISKKGLFNQFISCWDQRSGHRFSSELGKTTASTGDLLNTNLNCTKLSYFRCKLEAEEYRKAWNLCVKDAQLPWTQKPNNFEDFEVED